MKVPGPPKRAAASQTPATEAPRASGHSLRTALADALYKLLLEELGQRTMSGPAGGMDLDTLYAAARGTSKPTLWTAAALKHAVDDLVAAGRIWLEDTPGMVFAHPEPPLILA